MFEKTSKEQIVWITSAVVATFIVDGQWPRLDLILNPEYILHILILFVFVSAAGIVVGKVISKITKRELLYKTAVVVNALLTAGSLF